MTGDYDTTDRLMLGMPQNTIEVVKALNYLILSCSEEFQGISFFYNYEIQKLTKVFM